MNRIMGLIFLFTLVFAIMFLVPPFLTQPFGPLPSITWADVMDILTPLILLPIYWLMLLSASSNPLKLTITIVFVVLAALWAEGQGMHLSANSIGHQLSGMEGSDAYDVTHFYDEQLSHYLWHLGVVGLSGLLIFTEWRFGLAEVIVLRWPIIVAGIIHGLTIFLIIIEGGTAPLGIIFAISVVLITLIWGRKKLGYSQLITFFFFSYLLALVAIAGWAIYWGGLPEFSEVGLL